MILELVTGGGEQAPGELRHRGPQLGGLRDLEPVRQHREAPGVPLRVVGGCHQPRLGLAAGVQQAERARQPERDLGGRRVDQHVDGEAPALRQVLLEHAQRVKAGRRREPDRQRLGGHDPVYPQHPPRVPGVRPAQQVPAAVPEHHGPRVDLHRAFRRVVTVPARSEPVGQPQPPPGRAGLDQRTRQQRADPRPGGRCALAGLHRGARGRRARRVARDVADRADERRHRGGQHPDDLGEGPAHQVGRIGGGPVPLEHGHDEAGCLGGGERQRRQPQPAADLVAAVGAAHRVDRQPGLAQDRDVAPGGALGHPEPVAELLCGDPWDVLNGLKGEQCPGGRTDLVCHWQPPPRVIQEAECPRSTVP